MANNREKKLFTEFPEVSTARWEEVIAADLKGADYERKLVWKSTEGFAVRPYYRAEDLHNIKFMDSLAGEFPFVRGTCKSNSWRVHQSITVGDVAGANSEALAMLASGVDSLGFVITSDDFTAESLNSLLKGINLEATELKFSGKGLAAVAEALIAKVVAEGVAEKAKISFAIDPFTTPKKSSACCSSTPSSCIERIKSLIESVKELKGIRIVTISADTISSAGSTIVEELGFALAAGNEYMAQMTDAGVDGAVAAKKLRFSFSVSSNYFMEIAKFRAARMLWANIVKEYTDNRCAAKMSIFAKTATWNQTVYDPYVNMLRGTTEAMSATIAGVNTLEVTPFDASFRAPDDFSKRIARNVELLLKHESHFDQVVDPAGGSYYIENLTQSIATEAWKLLLEVEAKGGYAAAFEAGFVKERVEASAAAKDKAIATRRQILLGANQYPNFTEEADAAVTATTVERATSDDNTLQPYRGAMAFEAMRLEVDRSERTPKAFMLTCGNLSMARARSQFACNFFACAGIKVEDNTHFKSVEEGVTAALASKAEIVVICASDDDYAEVAPKAKALLGDKAILVVAGAPACAEELQAKGITNFINVRSNVLETLKFYLKEMGI